MKDADRLLKRLHETLASFEAEALEADLRERILALIPVLDTLRELGKATIPKGLQISARERLLTYFLAYPRVVLHEKELAVVAGISEWARRVRELRVQFGWKIITGVTAKEMFQENEFQDHDIAFEELSPNHYVLLDSHQDRQSAHRWNVANEIRRTVSGSRDRILAYLRANVGEAVTGEELRYVARSSEWARRTRELRTEDGWPIQTKMSGNPNLPVGVYVLEQDRQLPSHDRHIPDRIRREVLRRDDYRCRNCGWTYALWNPSDPRFLELHHSVHHVDGGPNEAANLITLCNVCHDDTHRLDAKG